MGNFINHKHDNKIPVDQRQEYIADGAQHLAKATLRLAQNGGIPPAEKRKVGQETIALARRALEIHTRLFGTEHERVAIDMSVLAEALNHFNDVDDEEVLLLHRLAIAIDTRLYGRTSTSVAIGESKWGGVYLARANRALAANELNRRTTMIELALPHLRESLRIDRVIGNVDSAAITAQIIAFCEHQLQ